MFNNMKLVKKIIANPNAKAAATKNIKKLPPQIL